MQLWQIAWVYHPMLHTFFTHAYVPLPTLCASLFSPKIPTQVSSESLLDDLPPSLAPTASPILFQPFAHGLDLLDELSSLLVHLVVVLRGRK